MTGSAAWGKVAERGYHKTITDTFRTFGWVTNHTFPLKTSDGGWRTATTLKGWPDLTAMRGEWIVACEIKGYSADGRPTAFKPNQIEVLSMFSRLGHGRAWVFRPTDPWNEVVAMMRFPDRAPAVFGFEAVDRLPR